MSFSTEKWQNFNALNHQIVKSLKIAGFDKPTKIQDEVLQQYRNYYDFLIASQTGSGKTLAFALPILSQMIESFKNASLDFIPPALMGLIITPTRQLAQQIQANVQQILKNIETKISVISIIGGMSKHRQLRIIRQRRPHIIIGTPGRIHEFLEDGVFNFQHLKYLVIDQADRMIELGHYVEVDKILEKIFRPKLKQFYEKDFHKITDSIAKKDKIKAKNQEALFVKQNGKKVRLNFDLHSIESDKLFEVPMEIFQFVNSEGAIQNLKKPEQDKPEGDAPQLMEVEQKIQLFKQLTEQELFWLNRLKRRIFFLSATLTREFKGQKYSIKRKRDDDEQNGSNKNNSKKKKNKFSKQKDEKKEGEGNEIQNIPKLKALLSRVNFSSKPKIIDQSSELFLPQGLKQIISLTDGENQRISLLLCYLKTLPANSKVLIFTNTIKASKRVQFFVQAMDYRCSNLHSHMEQKQRLTKLQRFKKSEVMNILISTDVSARGLDFTVNNVIQYGVPLNGDTYVHRAGRTARANRKGEALIIVDRSQGGKWCEINDILNDSVHNRKVDKFCPSKVIMDETQQKITQLQWIRVNNERQKDIRGQKVQQMEAQVIGIEPQEQEKRRNYDLDKQQQQMIRHEVKKKVQKIKKATHNNRSERPAQTGNTKWKKNKLILSPEDIIKMM